jgi:hypothetical protein
VIEITSIGQQSVKLALLLSSSVRAADKLQSDRVIMDYCVKNEAVANKRWLTLLWLNARFGKPLKKTSRNADMPDSTLQSEQSEPPVTETILFPVLCKQGEIEEAARFLVCDDDQYLHYAHKFAKKNGYRDIQKALGSNPKLKEGENEAISLACQIVDAMIKDREKDLSSHSNFALRFSCEYGKYDLVSAILRDHRVTPCSQSLKLAVLHGHTDIVKTILGHARLNLEERERIEILLYALQTENQKVISSLVSHPLFTME